MKKLFMGALLAAGIASLSFGQIDVKTLTWLDYQVTGDSNANWVNGGDFSIGRMYVTVQGDMGKDWFGNSIKGRVTLDLAKAQFNKIGAVPVPASIPIKLAWFDYGFNFASVATNEAGDEVKTSIVSLAVSAGLMPAYFGTIADWQYPLPVKDAVENYSGMVVTPSADFGLMLSGKVLPNDNYKDGLVKFYFQMLQGEGYNFLEDSSMNVSNANNYAGQGTVCVQPLPGLSIGGSFRYEDLGAYLGLNNAAGPNAGKSTTAWDAMLVVKDLKIGDMDPLPFDCSFQYIVLNQAPYGSTNAPNTASVFSGMLGYAIPVLNNTIYPYVRMDYVMPTTNTNGNYAMLFACVNITPTKNLSIKPMVDWKFDSTGAFRSIDIKVEGEYKLGFTLWQ